MTISSRERRGEVFCQLWAENAPPEWQWASDESFTQYFSQAIPNLFRRLQFLESHIGDYALREKSQIDELSDSARKLRHCKEAYSKMNDEVSQILGKALDYPWFYVDQEHFPGATEAHGVCVGEHVAESLAEEAAEQICELQTINTKLLQLSSKLILLCEKYAQRIEDRIPF